MRVPISWLEDYVDITLPVEELAEKLTIAGLEVKEIEYIGIPGGRDPDRLVWDRDKLVIGQILEVSQHPNADRLVLATVDYGGSGNEVVVTGAPNLFQYVGQGDLSHLKLYSPFALEGTTLYDGHKEGRVKMTLKGRNLRGIYNRCMLCSEKELGLSEEHEGILILEGDYTSNDPSASPSPLDFARGALRASALRTGLENRFTSGTPLQDVLGDAILEIDIIPNIARAASIVGVAREVAALTGVTLREPSYDVVQTGPPIEGKVVLSTENPEFNPRFVALLIEGVEQKPSPQWMQRRLKLVGQRPINVVVDISNYVMMEMGQPNHTFDYDFLGQRADQYDPEGPVHIITRLPRPGETLTTLDGITRELLPFNILVADPAGNLSLGGIMGGIESEINETTTNVLLEAAAWNFINIRRSASALKINSEASFRFSRGVHPSQALLGAKRAAELLRQLAGGTIAQGIVDYYPNPPQVKAIRLTATEVKRIGGIDLSLKEIKRMLEALEFQVSEERGDKREERREWESRRVGEWESGRVEEAPQLLVISPEHRLDIEGSHDLVEEVCRVYGYDRIPTTEMNDALPPQRSNVRLEREERIKDILVHSGVQEIITYRLTAPTREMKLLTPASSIGPDDRPYVTLANPITVDRVVMRHSLLASVMEIVAANSRFHERLALFELGQVYLASEDSDLPDELQRLSLLLTGPRQPEFWRDDSTAAALDFFDLKGIVEALFADLQVEGLRFETARHPTFRPGRTAQLFLNDQQVGIMGEIHPLVVEGFDVRSDYPVLAAEIDAEMLLEHIRDSYRVEPLPQYPAVREDIAVVVDKAVPAADVAEVIRRAGGHLLKGCELFDVYEGAPQVPAGHKSLAYHLTFQSANKTLTDKEVSKNRQRIVDQLARELGARLREA